jgi:hypothetical protein
LPNRWASGSASAPNSWPTSRGAKIEFIAKAHIRNEDVVAKVLASRGDHPGLVHVISVMEACPR